MTTFDSQLLLHLRLDALPGGKVVDSSSHARATTVVGTPRVVPDDRFGSSVRFGGKDHVQVADVTPQAGGHNPVLSVTGWVLLDALPTARSWLLTLGQAATGALHWQIDPDGRTHLGVWGNPGQLAPTLPVGVWTHIATVYDGKTLRAYVDGALWDKPVAASFNYTSWRFGLAKRELGEANLVGRVVGVRVYERALSQEDVQVVVDEDQSAMAAFRHSHPLAFSLHDPDDQPVLAIVDDPAGHTMRLEVTNEASQAITFTPVDPATGGSHLELRFRPGTLAPDQVPKITIATPEGWTSTTSTAVDGTVAFALAGEDRREIKPNETLRFTLHGIAADGRGGTRGTRVQLSYANLYYPDDPSALTGSRVQYLNVVNRRGQQQIPLAVGFIGTNTVLRDEQRKTVLRLRIANVGRRAIPLTPSGLPEPTALVLSFDTAHDWAMGTPAQLAALAITADHWRTEVPSEEGQTIAWRLTTPTQVALAPGDSIVVTVDGLLGWPPSGHSNLYVRHENVPGHWDGQTSVIVERSPLVTDDVTVGDQVDARVGIGTPSPRAKLEVAGGAIMPSLGKDATAGLLFPSVAGTEPEDGAWLRYYSIAGNAATLELGTGSEAGHDIALMPSGGVGVNTRTPRARLHVVHTNQDANGNSLMLGPLNQSHLRLGYHQDYSWIQSHYGKPLRINPLRNRVGIGAALPDATLDVSRGDAPGGTALFRGSSRISHFNHSTDEHTYIRGGKAGSNVYLNDDAGNVAIGGTDPQGNKLFVNGVTKVTGLRVNSGYTFGRMQAGQANAGTGTSGVNEAQFSFPEPFGSIPHVIVVPRNEALYPDTFAVTVAEVTTSSVKVKLLRLDSWQASWNQRLRLDWIAWE
ncbi:LamG domain-containing protein [Saccharothrix isguenensis]